MNGGGFDLNDHTQTVGNFSGTGGTVDLGTGAATVTGRDAGAIRPIIGSGSLTKKGTATLTLGGTNTYSAATRT